MALAPAAGPARSLRWPVIVTALAFTAGLAMIAVGFRSQSLVDTRFDPYFFGEMGKSFARGDGFAAYGSLIKRRAPLYPLVIGVIYSAFGERPLLVLLWQCLCHALTCLLVFDLGRRLFNQRTGAIAAVACALHPMLLRYVADLHLETQFTFLYVLMIWQMVRFHERPDVANGLLAGAAAGVASLTKAVPMLYPGLFAAALIAAGLLARRRGEKVELPWGGMAAMFVAMGLVIMPWTIRNYRATGHFVPISSGASDAFLRGYVFSKPEYALLRKPPYTDAENEVNVMFRELCAREGAVWEQDDYQTDQILNRAAKAKLAAEPLLFVRKFIIGLATFWYELTSLKNSLLVGGLALIAWAFALVGLRRAHQEKRPIWLLLLPVLYLNLLLAALLALGRYSAPVLPALLVVSAFGVDTLLSRRRAARA